jgi:ankyrin repeat protein
LFLQAKGGHNEAARYLIAKGADVTAVDENGDTALTVAKSPSMVRLLKGKPRGIICGVGFFHP